MNMKIHRKYSQTKIIKSYVIFRTQNLITISVIVLAILTAIENKKQSWIGNYFF